MDDNALRIWTIYQKGEPPFPEFHNCHETLVLPGGELKLGLYMIDPNIEELRVEMEMRGLTCIGRQEGDDPTILEVWL